MRSAGRGGVVGWAGSGDDGAVDPAEARLISRSVGLPDVSYRAFLDAQPAPRTYWAEPDGVELVGGGAAARLTARGGDRFDVVRSSARDVFDDGVDHEGPRATRPRMFGGFSFVVDHEPAPPWEGFPAAAFVLPRTQLTRTDERTWLTVAAFGPEADEERVERDLAAAREALSSLPAMQPSGGPPGVSRTRRTPARETWLRAVEDAVDGIQAGDLRKVVLATALEVDLATEIDVPDALERLRRSAPDCVRFLIQPTEGPGFFGPPPERLVALEGRAVATEALAGSVPRGETPEADAEYARTLLEDAKLQHEQGVVVDAIREQLDPLGEVRVGEQGVRRLATIQHLQTPIEATLDDDEHVLTLVEALHPTPAVGGVPPAAALEVIRETEPFDRGWYAAPVGWFDADGDGEFAVAIRSAVAGGRRATLFAGNGIVADSDPESEWTEVQHKFRPILDELEREADD